MPKTYREVRTALRRDSWFLIRIRGSHEVWGHPDGRRIAVSGGGRSGRQVPVGLLATIRRDTGLEELR